LREISLDLILTYSTYERMSIADCYMDTQDINVFKREITTQHLHSRSPYNWQPTYKSRQQLIATGMCTQQKLQPLLLSRDILPDIFRTIVNIAKVY
jgi:hypothetical protein